MGFHTKVGVLQHPHPVSAEIVRTQSDYMDAGTDAVQPWRAGDPNDHIRRFQHRRKMQNGRERSHDGRFESKKRHMGHAPRMRKDRKIALPF